MGACQPALGSINQMLWMWGVEWDMPSKISSSTIKSLLFPIHVLYILHTTR